MEGVRGSHGNFFQNIYLKLITAIKCRAQRDVSGRVQGNFRHRHISNLRSSKVRLGIIYKFIYLKDIS